MEIFMILSSLGIALVEVWFSLYMPSFLARLAFVAGPQLSIPYRALRAHTGTQPPTPPSQPPWPTTVESDLLVYCQPTESAPALMRERWGRRNHPGVARLQVAQDGEHLQLSSTLYPAPTLALVLLTCIPLLTGIRCQAPLAGLGTTALFGLVLFGLQYSVQTAAIRRHTLATLRFIATQWRDSKTNRNEKSKRTKGQNPRRKKPKSRR